MMSAAAKIIIGLFVAGAGIAGVASLAKASTKPTPKPGGGGGGGAGAGGATMTCDQALKALSVGGELGGIATDVKKLLSSAPTVANTTAATELADWIDIAQLSPELDAADVPKNARPALKTLSKCLRDYAKTGGIGGGGGGGGGGDVSKDTLDCVTALQKLDPILGASAKALLAGPKTAETAKNLRNLASSFEATAAQPAVPAAAKDVLMVSASCLRIEADKIGTGGGGDGGKGGGPGDGEVITDKNGVTSSWDGGPALKGAKTNPSFRWLHEVKEGESASRIAAYFFGSAGSRPNRWAELITENPTDYYSGAALPTTGNASNPASFNWTSLPVGTVLRIPKSWNGWIDQTGVTKGSSIPYPDPPAAKKAA